MRNAQLLTFTWKLQMAELKLDVWLSRKKQIIHIINAKTKSRQMKQNGYKQRGRSWLAFSQLHKMRANSKFKDLSRREGESKIKATNVISQKA